MQIKLKSGKTLDLSEDEIKEMLHTYKDWNEEKFDAEKLEHYFEEMHKKAHMNLEIISEMSIETEKDMKDALVVVMKYGTRAAVNALKDQIAADKIAQLRDEVMALKNQAVTAPLYGMIGGIQNTLNSVIGCSGVKVCPCNNTPVSGAITF